MDLSKLDILSYYLIGFKLHIVDIDSKLGVVSVLQGQGNTLVGGTQFCIAKILEFDIFDNITPNLTISPRNRLCRKS